MREAGYCLKVLNDMLESRSSRSFNAGNRGPGEIPALNPRPASPLMHEEHDLAIFMVDLPAETCLRQSSAHQAMKSDCDWSLSAAS